MRPRILGHVALAGALVGLGASIASLVDYLGDAPTFCAEDGCATVRHSAWAAPLGIPLPAIGIAYFLAMIGLAFVSRPRVRIALAAIGGGSAACLIALQAFVIGAWCKLCLVADPAGIVQAAAVLGGATTLRRSWRASLCVPALAAIVVGLGLWTHAPARETTVALPECVAKHQIPGAVTIVEFVDFECPFCRELDKRLTEALGKTRHQVRIVRKMVPLPSHPHAVPAAMAWCSADAQGRGDAMAKALFAAPPDDLTPAGCEALAVKLGCDVESYRATFASAELRQRIERDVADAHAANLEGFPTIFIGDQRFEGSNHTSEALLAAIEKAGRRAGR